MFAKRVIFYKAIYQIYTNCGSTTLSEALWGVFARNVYSQLQFHLWYGVD